MRPLTLQVRDDEVVMELQGSVLLHFVLQLKDGLLHVADLRLLLLQLDAPLLQSALLLGDLPLRLLLEAPVFTVQLQEEQKPLSKIINKIIPEDHCDIHSS